MIAGRPLAAHCDGDEVRLRVGRRRSRADLHLCAGWVVNCTGPMPANRPEANPAIASLLVGGHVRLDEMLLGIDTSATGNVISASGAEIPDLLVVGTLRKPAEWESTAVPELRGQAASVAGQLLEWVGRANSGAAHGTTPHSARA